MQVGSIVECISEDFGIQRIQNSKMGMIFPKRTKIYTVRHFFKLRDGRSGLLLEEIDNSFLAKYTPSKLEPAFRSKNFAELLMPIKNVEQEIINNTLQIDKLKSA